VRLPEPIVRIELEEAAICSLDWGNSELIAAGMANGTQSRRVDDV
jgi:transcription factor C subunit 6